MTAQQLLGAPDPSLPQVGAFAGQAPGGYYRRSGYRGILVHLLLGPFNGPASAQVMRTSLLHSYLHLLLMILLLLIKISPMMRFGLDQLLEPVLSCYNSR
jgi:hypothetical protein